MVELAIDGFVARRSAAWSELDAICARVEAGAPLDAATVLRLSQLYRETVGDLALVRRRFAGAPLVARLEELVSTAREVVYDAPRRPSPLPLIRFATRGWWRLVATSWAATLSALAILLACVAAAAVWADGHPVPAARTLPVALRRIPLGPHDDLGRAVGLPRGVPGLAASWTPLAALVIALLAIAGGLLAGVGTVAVLGALGLQLGVPVGLAVGAGAGARIMTLTAANGALLLLVVALAAGQGLRLGAALLTRRDAAAAGQRAALVLTGTLPFAGIAAVLQSLAGGGAGAGPVAPFGVLAVVALVAGVIALGGPPPRRSAAED